MAGTHPCNSAITRKSKFTTTVKSIVIKFSIIK